MKKTIAIIAIDPDSKSHEWNKVRTNYHDKTENTFDITLLDKSDEIYSVLDKNRGFDCLITIGNNIAFEILNNLSFEYRKKWIHYEVFNAKQIVSGVQATFIKNINRPRVGEELFSIFTCSYKTPDSDVLRLYQSLCQQTYHNWNWWVLDDSPEGTESYYDKLNDPRVTVIKNITNHGSIGFNKHMIAMCCDGDYLLEIDHDDEITPMCLEYIRNAFLKYPDTDFVYTYAVEEVDGTPVIYPNGFALGLGTYKRAIFNKAVYDIPETPDVNALSVRHIVGLPNHARCWKKEFYHRIGGHNTDLSVLDDMDLLIRTFLNGKMCKIPKFLYIQHEGTSSADNRSSTAQSSRMGEILRVGNLLRAKYNREIHEWLISHDYEDPYWNTAAAESNKDTVLDAWIVDLWDGPKKGTTNFNYIYNPDED